VPLYQLARLLYGSAGIAAGRILDQQLNLPAEDAAARIDLLDRELCADQIVLAEGRVRSGQWIVEADLDGVGGARRDDEGGGELRGSECQTGFKQGAPAGRPTKSRMEHDADSSSGVTWVLRRQRLCASLLELASSAVERGSSRGRTQNAMYPVRDHNSL